MAKEKKPVSLGIYGTAQVFTVNQTTANINGNGQHLSSVGEKEKTSYSDAELAEFKEIVLGRLRKAQKEYLVYKEASTNKSSNDVLDTSPGIISVDESQETFEKEKNTKLELRQLVYMQHLEAALVRIEKKTYGICRETGKLISKERLRAVPHATLSVEGKNQTKVH